VVGEEPRLNHDEEQSDRRREHAEEQRLEGVASDRPRTRDLGAPDEIRRHGRRAVDRRRVPDRDVLRRRRVPWHARMMQTRRVRQPTPVFLYGPPAAGKLTVAKAMAARAPVRILHNHIVLDAVLSVLDRSDPSFWELVGSFRAQLVEAASRAGVDVVYTYVFAPGDEPHVDRIVNAWERPGGRVLFARLVVPRDELFKRVGDAGRREHRKIVDPDELEHVLAEYDVFQPIADRDGLTIDASTTAPDDAAALIVEALR